MIRILAAVLCGVFIGTLSGILGVGGGTMMVPLFRLGFGLSAMAATGTSMFAMIFTSIGGSISHVRNKTCIVPLGLIAGCFGALTAPIGVRLAAASPAWMVMVATALVVAYSAITMIRKGLAIPKNSADAGKIAPKSAASAPEMPQLTRRQYVMGAVAGIVAGVAGGYVGLGGGFLMVPVFLSGVGITMKHASGTSLIGVAIIALSAAITQGTLGNIDVFVGLAMAAGSVPAAMLSATLITRIPERSLRLGFGGFLLIVSVMLAFNELVLQG